MGADLLKVQFREGKDGNPPVTCTSLQLFRPEFTTYFDCDQEYAAVYSRRYQAFHPGEGKDVVMVYKVATGETWTWSLVCISAFSVQIAMALNILLSIRLVRDATNSSDH